jgi:hypothetical protein
MPLYYFDSRDNETFIPDELGVEIASLDEVKLTASKQWPTSPRTFCQVPWSGFFQ